MKTLSTEIEYGSPYIQVVNTSYKDNNNNEKNYYWVKRNENQEAVIIAAIRRAGIYSQESKLVLTKEFRIPINDYEWGLPAGLIEKNETPEQAATRELYEETGLIIKEVYSTSPPIYSSSGITNEAVYTVFCSVDGDISNQNQESSEDIETYQLTKEQVKDLLKNKEIKFGAKAYFIMMLFITSAI